MTVKGSPAQTAAPFARELSRALGLADSAAIIVGTVIGAGIFLAPRLVAQAVPSPVLILAVWISCGALCFFGALAYAEMGAMMPETGGHYVYVRECFGPLAGFLCGWTFALAVFSAAMAWLAVSFAITLGYFLPLGPVAAKIIGLALIGVLSLVNYRGIRFGAAVQKIFTLLKILGVAVIVGSAFLPGREHVPANWPLPSPFPWSAFGVAMIAVLLCYDGWTNISYMAGEVRNPQKNVPLALALGLSVIALVYVLANVAYLRVLPVSVIAEAERTGAAFAGRTLGQAGGAILSVTILLSIVGSINGFILAAPRVCFAMARDGLMFGKMAAIHPRYQTLSFGIAAQAIWTAVLILTGSFETLASYAMIAAWLFYGLAVACVVILRHKHPSRERPYRMWGYPLTPLLFSAAALWFVVNTWITQPGPSLAAFGIIAAGIPVYCLLRRKPQRAHAGESAAE